MPHDAITVIPAAPHLGAEVVGVDLGRVTDRQAEELHRALSRHRALYLRDEEVGRVTLLWRRPDGACGAARCGSLGEAAALAARSVGTPEG